MKTIKGRSRGQTKIFIELREPVIKITGGYINETIDCLYRSIFYATKNQSLNDFLEYRLQHHINGKCYNQAIISNKRSGDHSVRSVLRHNQICHLRNTPRKKWTFLYLSVDFFNLCKIGNLFIVDLLFLLCFVLCQSLFMTAFPYPSFSRMSATTDITVPYVQCRIMHLTLMITQVSRRRKCFQAFLTLKLFLPGMRCQLVKFKFLICCIGTVTLITSERARIFSPWK